ncbi:MAG TPA: iron-sulfur cluster assembly accessory protein [Armatimonadota bacterium]|jgi:iron-sulfur cluster assembly protein
MVETLTLDTAAEAIKITPQASIQAKKLLARKHPDNPEMGFRMGVRGGGCSGLSYFLDLDDKVSKWDLVFNVDGIKFIVDKKSLLYLKGTTLTWSGNLMGGGFEFDNPNAAKSCGCGTSFSI